LDGDFAMSDTIVTSLIATAGVLISVIVSLLTSLRQIKIETRKLRDEYLRQYAGKLFEKRIEVYPVLSSTVVEIINFSKVSVTDIKRLAQALLKWEAHNVIFLSAQPEQVIHRLALMLADLNKMNDSDLQKVLDEKESLKKIKHPHTQDAFYIYPYISLKQRHH
jgi:shikimate kinase